MAGFDRANRPAAAGREGPAPTGRPLARDVQAYLERGLQHDLAHIRVHHDAASGAAARDAEARALTVGPDIILAPG
jgi:Domain of unknown function (DUF4157)